MHDKFPDEGPWQTYEQREEAYMQWLRARKTPAQRRRLDSYQKYYTFDKRQKGLLYRLRIGEKVRQSTMEKMNVMYI